LTALCTFLDKSGNLLPGECGLGGLMAKAYLDMAKSPAFWMTGSAVPFCLSTNPKGGHLFLHVPPEASASTPVLLLLHGYGGNLLYFPWAIWREMSDCVLIAPSWQVDWTKGPLADRKTYVGEALRRAADHAGVEFGRPWLVALSQGGPAAFELANDEPSKFQGLLGLSTYSGNSAIDKIPKKFPVRLLHGDSDARVACSDALDTILEIQRRGGNAERTVVKGADHFLVLSHRKSVGRFLRENMDQIPRPAKKSAKSGNSSAKPRR